MSALGSSVIHKSSKKFAPKKAPIRRAATSTQTSARPSVDRQLHSQTPQPQLQPSQQRAAASPAPAPSILVTDPAASEPAATPAQIANQNNVAVTANAAASQAVEIPRLGTTRGAPRTQIVEANTSDNARRPSPAAIAHVQEATATAIQSSSEPTTTGPHLQQFHPVQTHPSGIPILQPTPTPIVTARSNIDEAEQRAAKRRRIETPAEDRASQTPDNANRTEGGARSHEADETASNVFIGPAAPSQIYSQPIRQSIEPVQTAKPTKPRITKQAKQRKQAIAVAAAEVVADAVGERLSKRKQVGKSRRTKPAATNAAQPTADELAAAVVEDAVKSKKPKKKRKKRDSTPEGAEDIQIIPSQVTMSELTGNVRTGRRSSRDKELEEMYQAEKEKKKLARKNAREGNTTESQQPEDQEPTETAEERLERLARERHRSPSYDRAVPTTIIVNGQIQLDESSLVIDRHARAARAREAVAEEAVEETELTRRVNAMSWLKVDRSGGWNEMLTDQFYDGLRMFGTDFYMISKMFPGRTRHSVKLKFNKEEKLNAWRIEATLRGENLPVNMDEYSKASNTVYSDPKELDREMDEDRQKIEREEAQAKAAMEEADRERAEQAAREAAADGEEESGKENETDGVEESGYVTMKQKRKEKRKTFREKARKEYKSGKRGAAARPQATTGSGGVTS